MLKISISTAIFLDYVFSVLGRTGKLLIKLFQVKKGLIFCFILISSIGYSQRKINYNFTLNTTFTVNENFGEYDEFFNDTDWSLFVPRAILFRNGLDIQVNKFLSAGVYIGLDYHPDLDILAIPYYIDSKLRIIQVDDDNFFVNGGLGKLMKPGKAFERGNYYKIGVGYMISTQKESSFIINIDFHRKTIANFENGQLDSLSVGFGIMFL